MKKVWCSTLSNHVWIGRLLHCSNCGFTKGQAKAIHRLENAKAQLVRYVAASLVVEEACLSFNPSNFKDLEDERSMAWRTIDPGVKKLITKDLPKINGPVQPRLFKE